MNSRDEIKAGIEESLAATIPSTDKAHYANVLADLWEHCSMMADRVAKLARSATPGEELLAILTQLDNAEWEVVWIRDGAQDAWRDIKGEDWSSESDDINQVKSMICGRWPALKGAKPLAAKMVELRRLVTVLSAKLTTPGLVSVIDVEHPESSLVLHELLSSVRDVTEETLRQWPSGRDEHPGR